MTCIAYHCTHAYGGSNPTPGFQLFDESANRLIAVLPTETSDASLHSVASALGYELTEIAR